MAVPKYNELYLPLLRALQDGNVRTMQELRDIVSQSLSLTAEDLAERLPSNGASLFADRLGWARSYLKKAGLVAAPQRGRLAITSTGKELLDSGKPITNALLAERSSTFTDFYRPKNNVTPVSATQPDAPVLVEDVQETPQETLEHAYSLINDQLADDLLTEVLQQSPAFFEQLVVDLMKAMNYGEGFVTKYSGDDGIDGIIHEDRLGFNLIYIQAKRWKPDITIGKPELQKFAGAMMGPPKVEKGLFITTAKFSQKAQEFATAQHIILVDGKKLTDLMIEYGVGVSTQKTYLIKRVDTDYFTDD